MKKELLPLDKKVALITGAARGIGRVIAEVLACAGASVIITDMQRSSGRLVAKGIRNTGGSAVFIYADLRKENDIKSLVHTGIQKFGRLDIIINNARPKLSILPFNESFKEWNLGMSVLLKAPALVVKYAMPYLIKSKKASIVNVASTNAFFISHQPLVYHVAKAGLIQLTRYIAFQFGKEGIRANVVCPGLVDLSDVKRPLTSDNINKNVVKLAVPLNRAASAQEVANIVLTLCTDTSSYVTGQTINIDGGITLGDQFYVARKSFIEAQVQSVKEKKSNYEKS